MSAVKRNGKWSKIQSAEAETIFRQVNEGHWTFDEAASNFGMTRRGLEERLLDLGYRRRRSWTDIIVKEGPSSNGTHDSGSAPEAEAAAS